jgi:hypothetical protein
MDMKDFLEIYAFFFAILAEKRAFRLSRKGLGG